MYTRAFYQLTLCLLVALLVGCGTPSTSMTPATTTSVTLPETSTLTREVEVPSPTTAVTTQTPDDMGITQASSLPDGWHYVEWQALRVPLPPGASDIVPPPARATDQTHNISILATGVVNLPPPPPPTDGAIGEYPAPPSLTLLRFSGTLDEWIALEETAIAGEDGGVMEPVESLTVAGREARHYQRTVPGFNYNDYYVLKPTETTLLLINTDKVAYQPLVDALAFVTP